MNATGIDLSLNHLGVITLDVESGKRTDFVYVTGVKGSYDRAPEGHAFRVSKQTDPDLTIREMRRLSEMSIIIGEILDRDPGHVWLEDYAYGMRGGEKIAELTSLLKIRMWMRGIPFRLLSPTTVKLLATGDGGASKDEVMRAVASWGFDYGQYNQPASKKAPRVELNVGADTEPLKKRRQSDPHKRTEEDLCDAHVLAAGCRLELLLRSGRLTLEQLEERERAVFLRVTKAHPTNIIATPWAAR